MFSFQFSLNVELGINAKSFNASQRNEFVRDICILVATYTRYPTETERQLIAQKIVMKFAFLKDPTIGQNSNEWVSRAFHGPRIFF